MRALSALLALLLVTPAQAILPATQPAPEATADAPAQTIEETQEAGADERIAERIRGIFREMPALEGVSVEVNEGVVALSGTVPAAEDIDRAEAVAGRVSGVVTVENAIERDVSVDGGLGGLASVQGKFADFVRLVPLIAVAIGVAVAIALFGWLIAGLTGLWRRIALNSFLAELIASAIRFGFIVGGIVIALDMVGAGALMGAVLGGAGVIGIALGFAMRDTIENYVASLMLSLRQPFRANDHVVIDTHEGRVIRLTSRATILMTLDGNHLRIPNGQVFRAVILNYTRNPQRRFDFLLGIDADDDPAAARRVGRETLASLDFVLSDPPPEVLISEVGDSNILLRFLGWIDQREADWLKARTRAIAAVKAALEEAGFALPEPIYRLRFDPRTNPLPLQNVAGAGAPKQEKRPSRTVSATVTEAKEDIAPDDDIARMVEEERAAEPPDRDLLDQSRPVE
ncbi:MAG: mechanosensitive ion channel domain-containing protein [Qipengyuania sp.]